MELDRTDPEWTETDNTLHLVSGGAAGVAFNDLCKMLGGQWPDAKMRNEAPKAYEFFMKML